MIVPLSVRRMEGFGCPLCSNPQKSTFSLPDDSRVLLYVGFCLENILRQSRIIDTHAVDGAVVRDIRMTRSDRLHPYSPHRRNSLWT